MGLLSLLPLSLSLSFSLFLSRVIFKIMKFAPILLFVIAIVFAAEEKEEERPKTFRRLIPADVLRGKFLSFFLSFFVFLLSIIFKIWKIQI